MCDTSHMTINVYFAKCFSHMGNVCTLDVENDFPGHFSHKESMWILHMEKQFTQTFSTCGKHVENIWAFNQDFCIQSVGL